MVFITKRTVVNKLLLTTSYEFTFYTVKKKDQKDLFSKNIFSNIVQSKTVSFLFFELLDQNKSQRILCVTCNFRTCPTFCLDLQVSRRIFNWNIPFWGIKSMCLDNYVYMSSVELHESTALWPNSFSCFASHTGNIGREWFTWYQIMHNFFC